MPSTPLSQALRHLWTLEPFAYSLRVFIALAGVMVLCWWRGDMASLIPLFLGIIASALAETDDNWQDRLRALLVTLGCFTVAALAVELLFDRPWLFATGLALSTFAMTMLGAVNQRYATIASATLILAIYTMIGLEQRGAAALDELWHEPALLVAGAAWYGAISVVWCALFSRQPLKQALAQVFRELARYLVLKSALFEPLRDLDVEARRLALARQNGRVVEALNQAKEMLFRRLPGQRDGGKLDRYLHLYFIAQDIHERASSTHYPYVDLAAAFFHHDVLFRAQRLLDQQGRACKALSRALLLNRSFDHAQSGRALEDLDASVAHLRAQGRPEWRDLLHSLEALVANLATLERALAGAQQPEPGAEGGDDTLYDRTPRGVKDVRERILVQLTPGSPVFRHALRLTVTLVTGYGVLHLIHPTQGYWILLTSVFVCRPSFGATRRFLWQRIQGTVLGLVAGWALITLFPAPLVQAAIAVLAGVAFFALRGRHYTLATASITLMVLCCFNQVGDGFGLIWPRLFDTLLGAGIAGLAVLLILPDWQGRRLHRQAAAALAANRAYLGAILDQYDQGKRDDLGYRLARRNAHNADAELSTLLGNVLQEPGPFRKDADTGLRFLLHSHTLLNYLSTLGAHRGEGEGTRDAPIGELATAIEASLERLAHGLARREPVAGEDEAFGMLTARLERLAGEETQGARRLLQTQLALIGRQLGPLREVAAQLVAR
ncbi:YccS family putative transporter [Halomonas heilongjiangensis]|uniref:TIGR01666 family membrane protein n=1 Tax=Halomonas heilongjiangensis TaxID=1387883 RepID=A0A2N7TSN2_9GAMM|nr:YccS family putative transporter [Halomonas heilongjiangensis]PMR71197.1 TIGR01666 family membrane protein [Halomonas heilongjiangensis]PXX92953.1 TIGR01666 family membrane protein [Halomonas heilongjiangensis]